MQCMLQSEYCGVWHHIKVEALSSVFYLKCLQNCRKDKWQAQNYYHLNFMFPQITFINSLLRLDQMHCWLNTACRPQICHPVLSMYTVFVWSGGCLGGREGPGSVTCFNSQYASAIMCLIKHFSCQYTYQMYSFTVARKNSPLQFYTGMGDVYCISCSWWWGEGFTISSKVASITRNLWSYGLLNCTNTTQKFIVNWLYVTYS